MDETSLRKPFLSLADIVIPITLIRCKIYMGLIKLGVLMKTIYFENGRVILIDQTLLPERLEYIKCRDVECIARAIENLSVRGAPALGIAGSLGLALAAHISKGSTKKEVLEDLERAYERLKKTRPTAVNLFGAMDRVLKAAAESENPKDSAFHAAMEIYEEDITINRQLEKIGSEILEDGDVVLTHCNAGSLATSGFGTAQGIIKEAYRQGKKIQVFADETRPLLQGARLTAFEMTETGVPVTVITDSMAGFVMKNRGVTKVIVGADRISLNGDVANKIGTYQLAVLAKEHKIPFYVAAPTTTIEQSSGSGKDIPIEYRKREEIEFFNKKRIVPEKAEILNPAFDITPARYIKGIITEKGILKPPLGEVTSKNKR